ncbi:MAG: NAD(P)/FAD-dependent oxidoreductase [Crocinitomix sp.]|nr:NAD(P)/FAD-dependent oxidoreductase [Crocinitomix sp.]
MTKDKRNYEVIIIGGGPAGIATSLTLTNRGISNCLVEAKHLPQKKTGEAIPPNAKPLLKKLGIYELMEDPKHCIYYGNKSSWGSEKLEQKAFIKDIYGHGFLLDRLHFETQLRAHLEKCGGDFLAGYRLKKVVKGEKGITATIENTAAAITLTAKYIVDATGRKASVCQQLGIKKRFLDAQFALTSSVQLSQEIAREIVVEATPNGWWYAAPQGHKELTLMFFTLKSLIPDKVNSTQFWRAELKSSLHISKLVNAENCDFGPIKILPCGTSRLEIPFGENWMAVGDAAYSFDPISSYGITSALASGMYGGHALASAIEGKTDAMLTYRYLMEKAYQGYAEKLVGHYASEERWKDEPYWMGSR